MASRFGSTIGTNHIVQTNGNLMRPTLSAFGRKRWILNGRRAENGASNSGGEDRFDVRLGPQPATGLDRNANLYQRPQCGPFVFFSRAGRIEVDYVQPGGTAVFESLR
jgi:hypothetical protein